MPVQVTDILRDSKLARSLKVNMGRKLKANQEKIESALDTYAPFYDVPDVIMFYDDTADGSAKHGFVVTNSEILWLSANAEQGCSAKLNALKLERNDGLKINDQPFVMEQFSAEDYDNMFEALSALSSAPSEQAESHQDSAVAPESPAPEVAPEANSADVGTEAVSTGGADTQDTKEEASVQATEATEATEVTESDQPSISAPATTEQAADAEFSLTPSEPTPTESAEPEPLNQSNSEQARNNPELYREYLAKIVWTYGPKGDKFYYPSSFGSIQKKLVNAVNSYAAGADISQIFAIYDDTVFGSAKNGYVLTTTHFYAKVAFKPSIVTPLDQLSVYLNGNKLYVNDDRLDFTQWSRKDIPFVYQMLSNAAKLARFEDVDCLEDPEALQARLEKDPARKVVLDAHKGITGWLSDGDRVFVYPNVPEKTFAGALSYKFIRGEAKLTDALVLIDCSLTKNGGCGVAFMPHGVWLCALFSSGTFFKYDSITSLYCDDKKVYVNGHEFELNEANCYQVLCLINECQKHYTGRDFIAEQENQRKKEAEEREARRQKAAEEAKLSDILSSINACKTLRINSDNLTASLDYISKVNPDSWVLKWMRDPRSVVPQRSAYSQSFSKMHEAFITVPAAVFDKEREDILRQMHQGFVAGFFFVGNILTSVVSTVKLVKDFEQALQQPAGEYASQETVLYSPLTVENASEYIAKTLSIRSIDKDNLSPEALAAPVLSSEDLQMLKEELCSDLTLASLALEQFIIIARDAKSQLPKEIFLVVYSFMLSSLFFLFLYPFIESKGKFALHQSFVTSNLNNLSPFERESIDWNDLLKKDIENLGDTKYLLNSLLYDEDDLDDRLFGEFYLAISQHEEDHDAQGLFKAMFNNICHVPIDLLFDIHYKFLLKKDDIRPYPCGLRLLDNNKNISRVLKAQYASILAGLFIANSDQIKSKDNSDDVQTMLLKCLNKYTLQ